MNKPSEPLLRWLRKLLKERNITAASLAEIASLQRARVRQVLSGSEPMNVDELMAISQALKLSPGDFGLGEAIDLPSYAEPPSTEEEDDEESLDDAVPMSLYPLGNQPRQLFEVAFALGCDFLFLARAGDLVGSGVPPQVLDRYANRELPIKLDAAYHAHNNPRYAETGVTLTLSFDSLCECQFPWASIRQVVFFPAAPNPVVDEPETKSKDRPARGHLRLVE